MSAARAAAFVATLLPLVASTVCRLLFDAAASGGGRSSCACLSWRVHRRVRRHTNECAVGLLDELQLVSPRAEATTVRGLLRRLWLRLRLLLVRWWGLVLVGGFLPATLLGRLASAVLLLVLLLPFLALLPAGCIVLLWFRPLLVSLIFSVVAYPPAPLCLCLCLLLLLLLRCYLAVRPVVLVLPLLLPLSPRTAPSPFLCFCAVVQGNPYLSVAKQTVVEGVLLKRATCV